MLQASAASILRRTSGLSWDAKNASDIIETFRLLITQEMVNVIVRENNRKAKQVIATWNQAHRANEKTWEDTNETDLYALIGILLSAGVYRYANESL
jgi:proteasome assembly chaperone (PAC2) family protein